MSAAIAAAESGLSCTIVDEGTALGGQIYRKPHPNTRDNAPGVVSPKGDSLRQRVTELADKIKVRPSSVVWGISEDGKVAVGSEDTGTVFMRPAKIILATGAYEYTPPFPGWTLPGVMTPGSAQILTKAMSVKPGGRVVIAGTGPLLYVVASQLIEMEVNVVAVIEAAPRSAWLGLAVKGWRAAEILKQGYGYLTTIRKAGVPVHYGHVVTRAEGDNEVERISYAPVDQQWNPDLNRSKTLEADTLCIGYGLQPRNYMAQLAGCEIEFDELKGGWLPVRDNDMQTSKEHILAAGDGAGIAGGLTAELEGRVAGLVVSHQLGKLSDRELHASRKPLQKELARIGGLQSELARIHQIRSGLTRLVEPDTIVCRCEEIVWREAKTAIEAGGCNFRTLKVMTRIGMGMCQARFCWPGVSRLMAQENNAVITEIGPVRPRPPIRPVSLATIAAASVSGEQPE